MIGYSWVDAHLVVLGSPGVGWPVAWKRLVLVLIGTLPFNQCTLLHPLTCNLVRICRLFHSHDATTYIWAQGCSSP